MSAEEDIKVWEQIAVEHPKFFPLHHYFENYHAVREIVLGGSVTWAGVHKRWRPAPGMNVMDVGANVGVFAAYAAVYGCRVTAYEPFFEAFEKIPILGNMRAEQAAINTYTGTTMYLGTQSRIEEGNCPAMNGSIPTDGINWNDADKPQLRKVACVSFEEALGNQPWDMVKMDIEGAECEVLLATPDRALGQIKFMYVEFHPWVSKELYLDTLVRLASVFHLETAYFNEQIGRVEGAYCRL